MNEAKRNEESEPQGGDFDRVVILPPEIGAAAVGAYNEAKKLEWENRPECCGAKVSGFDCGYICDLCERIFD